MERDEWIERTMAGLSIEQKVELLSGADVWHTVAIDEAGIPAITVTDGPNGVRGTAGASLRTTSFPSGTALGATWDPALAAEIGAALAAEVADIGAHVLLGPTVNLHRSPLAGRNFECYSEDPFLSGELAVGFVQGVQGAGIGACIKHFVANDSEFERMTISSEVDERTLRELYLVPFERAVAVARPWSLMAAYNRINGTYACAHRELLVEVLKEEWGFDGAVISDWGAVHDTEGTANGGTDLEMPGPARHFGPKLVAAVESGAVDEEVVDDKVRRLLRLIERTGARQRPARDQPEGSVARPGHRSLARRAATEAIVLLRNEGGALPLAPGPSLRRLAVLGAHATDAAFQGGGSSAVKPERVVQPLEAIEGRAGTEIAVVHEPGAHAQRYVPEPPREWFEPRDDAGRGLLVEYFDAYGPGGEPVSSRLVPQASWTWWDAPEGISGPAFAARWTGRLRPPSSGRWLFGVAAVGRARLFVDDVEVVDNWTAPRPGALAYGAGSEEVVGVAEVDAEAGHDIRIELSASAWGSAGPTAIRVGMAPAPPPGALDRAVDAAAQADAAIVVVGTSADWEGEGFDRTTMALPGDQDELIHRVAAVNDRTIVVVNTGSPVEMPWADEVAAIVQLWFPGQELGAALADVLFGDAEPGGRLPTSFPVAYRHHPALFGYPGESGQVRYGEGVFIGYRGYQARGLEPRFPFGHGLSYTSFEHGDLLVDLVADPAVWAGGHEPEAARRPPAVAVARVDVTNTGDRPGTEVVQLFVGPPPGPLARPPLELKGFAKVALEPGERRTVTLPLDARAFAAYDPHLPGWRARPGVHRLVVASSGRPVREAPLVLPSPVELPVR